MDGQLSQRKPTDRRKNNRKSVSGAGSSPRWGSTKLREARLSDTLEQLAIDGAESLETLRREVRARDLADSEHPALTHTAKLNAACETLRRLLAQALQTSGAERKLLALEFESVTQHALALIRMNIETVLSMPLKLEDLRAAMENSRLADCIMQEIRAIVCVLEQPPADENLIQ